jgi:hypothetical protein
MLITVDPALSRWPSLANIRQVQSLRQRCRGDAMLPLIIFFILGVALGTIGLRLLAHWEHTRLDKPHLGDSHRRH